LAHGLVWVSGGNGAGKTTTLEAIYLLDRGRTFRGRRAGPLTTRGEASTILNGVARAGDRRWPLQWTDAGGERDHSRPLLSRFVGAETFSLVESEPGLRRRFVDWAMFHVEPGAREQHRATHRLVEQRNAWLRGGAGGIPVWDGPYAAHLAKLSASRCEFVAALNQYFARLVGQYLPNVGLQLAWRGPGDEGELRAALAAQHAGDLQRGYTLLSPGRGDLLFQQGDRRWYGSRGENKLVGTLLQLAAQQLGAERTGFRSVAMLDDPYAEVAEDRLEPIIRAWLDAADQVLVASLRPPTGGLAPAALFHVEQGMISIR
jgi:DNA replication and repair protein RecF